MIMKNKKTKSRKSVTFGVGGASSNPTIVKAHALRMYAPKDSEPSVKNGKIIR